MTAYLKDKNFWTLIKIILEEQQAQKSDKISELTATKIIKISENANDSITERSILMHQILIKKWLKNSEKKN